MIIICRYLFISNHTNTNFFSNLWNLGTYTSITKFLLKVSEYIYRGGWRIEIYNKGILIKFFLLLLFNILYYVRNNIIWDSVLIQKDIAALLPTIWMIIINIVCRTPMYDISRDTTKSAYMNEGLRFFQIEKKTL